MKKGRALILSLAVSLTAWSAWAQAPATAGKKPWLQAEKAGDRAWRISDNNSDNMYLVEGSDKALLIDTGLGVARLSDFVKTLTSKPVIVVNTHGHPDHAGGNYQFKTVYAHPADFAAIHQLNTKLSRTQRAAGTAKQNPGFDLIPADEAAAAPEAELLAIKDGYVFDLGGRKVEVIETPGHTPGEIVLLDAANKAIFTGDNSNGLVWLFLPNSLPLETYLQTLKKLQARVGEGNTIHPGHGGPMPGTFFGEQIGCVASILDGSAKSEPYKSFAGDAMLARFKSASVAYNPQNLRIKK